MKHLTSFILLVAFLSPGCSRQNLRWDEQMLVGKIYDAVDASGRGLRLVFSSLPAHSVEVRQRPDASPGALDPVGTWEWRIDGKWLVFTDQKGTVHDQL